MRLDRLREQRLPGELRVAQATRPVARLVGLAGLRDLPADRALRLPRCRSVHTFGMRFALDLVWLDASGVVVEVTREVPPRHVVGCSRARSVVETRAGEADRFTRALTAAAQEVSDV